MEFAIKTNPLLPAHALMMIMQDGDGIEVATADAVRFFTWEEVRSLQLKIVPLPTAKP